MSFRNIKNINIADLTKGIDCFPIISPPFTPDQLACHYNDSLRTLLDTLAPLKTQTVSFPHSAPWFSPHLHLLKAKGRQLERLFRKTGLTIHRCTMPISFITKTPSPQPKPNISPIRSLRVLGTPGPCSHWSTIHYAPLIPSPHTFTPMSIATP